MKLVRGKRIDEEWATAHDLFALVQMFEKICDAVAFAHAHQVIHRDLKPQNIMIGPFGEVLVLDWGVAKVLRHPKLLAVDSEADTLMLTTRANRGGSRPDDKYPDTAPGTVIGTAGYMAPEQLLGETEQLEERSDVYALGAVLYFLLTDQSPRRENRAVSARES